MVGVRRIPNTDCEHLLRSRKGFSSVSVDIVANWERHRCLHRGRSEGSRPALLHTDSFQFLCSFSVGAFLS